VGSRKRRHDATSPAAAAAAAPEANTASPALSGDAKRVRRSSDADVSTTVTKTASATTAAVSAAEPTVLDVRNETPGAVHIEEINMDGFFVRLANLTAEEVDLSHWTLASSPSGYLVLFFVCLFVEHLRDL
jgi:hypothetical protein